MARNTNLNDIDFPVSLEPIYLKSNFNSEIGKYKAVKGNVNGEDKIFAIVSKDYSLISNSDAVDLGKNIFKEFFPAIGESKLEVFNVTYPGTKSFCNIDIINECYTFNIWDTEVFIPFMRITNSYNRTKTLKFEIGFSRKVCDNGVIFEKEAVELNYTHYKKSFKNITENIKSGNQFEKLKKLEEEFTIFMKNLKSMDIKEKYYTPLTAKIFGLKFNTDSGSKKEKEYAFKKLTYFKNISNNLTKKYISELGENAYSVFNVATAFANNREFVKNYRYNDYQVKAGEWLKAFAKRDADESLENYLKDYKYLMN